MRENIRDFYLLGDNIVNILGYKRWSIPYLKFWYGNKLFKELKIPDEILFRKFGVGRDRYKFQNWEAENQWESRIIEPLIQAIADISRIPIIEFDPVFVQEFKKHIEKYNKSLYIEKNGLTIIIKKKTLFGKDKELGKLDLYKEYYDNTVFFTCLRKCEIYLGSSDKNKLESGKIENYINNFIRSYDNGQHNYDQAISEKVNKLLEEKRAEALLSLGVPLQANTEMPELIVPAGSDTVISMNTVKNGNILVNWADPGSQRESHYGRYYTKANYNSIPVPKKNPATRRLIQNPKLYRAVVKGEESSATSVANSRPEPSAPVANTSLPSNNRPETSANVTNRSSVPMRNNGSANENTDPISPNNENNVSQSAGFKMLKNKSRKQKQTKKGTRKGRK